MPRIKSGAATIRGGLGLYCFIEFIYKLLLQLTGLQSKRKMGIREIFTLLASIVP